MDRVLEAFRLSQDRRGRAAYVSWLEARAENEGGKIDAKAMEAIRGGWYLGEQGFKDKLLELIGKAGAKIRDRGNLAGAAVRAHDEKEAERIIRIVGTEMELPESAADLELLRKGDPRKVMCAAMVKRPHIGEERLAGQPTADGPSCGHEPVGKPDSEGSKEPKNFKEV